MHLDGSGVIAIQVPNRIYLPSTDVFMKHEGGFVLSERGRAANVWLQLSMRFSEAFLPEFRKILRKYGRKFITVHGAGFKQLFFQTS